ncbi:MAG: FAD-dependent oxidoreductase, partial [Myxococcota bacterium]
TYNGSNPYTAPATLGCIAWVELGMGGYAIEGGMSRLVDALVEVAQGLGVQLNYSAPVDRIVVQSKTVRGMMVQGSRRNCDALVVNADVAHLFQDLWPSAPSRLQPGGEPSTSGFNAIIKARPLPTPRAPHMVLFPKTYKNEFRDLFDRKTAPEEPTVYMCAQSTCNGRPGWDDAEPLFVMINAPADPTPMPEYWSDMEQKIRDRLLQANLLLEGDEVLWRRTPRGLAERFVGSRGSLYGAASHGPRSAFTRPANRVPGIQGLYLASGSAHPGGGMPLATQSGHLAAQALQEDLQPKRRRFTA